MTEHITIKDFLKRIDLMIQSMKNQKQWYLDYRCGSGMTPMLEEFASILDNDISKLELIKTISVNIEPRSLLEPVRITQESKGD